MRRAATYVMKAFLFVVAVSAISGCAGGAATSKFTLTVSGTQLPAKPDNCFIEVVPQTATPKKAYIVIGDIFVGGGDVLNPRLSGCMNLGVALEQAKQIACRNGGDAIVSALLDTGNGCASVLGNVAVYK